MSTVESLDSKSPQVSHLAGASVVCPFGLPKDPHTLKGVSYTTPVSLVSSAVYAVSPRIFSYKSLGDEHALDGSLKLWSQLNRKNADDVVPQLSTFEVRSGASSAVLGYLDNQTSVVPLITSGASLPFFEPTLKKSLTRQSLSFQVSALDYDEESGSLVSNYVTPLHFAQSLNYAVFTPLNPQEAQHMSILSLAFSQIQNSVNLYDGPGYIRDSVKVSNVLDQEKLGSVYHRLVSAAPLWSQLSAVQRPAAALSTLNSIVGTEYKPFEYFGSKDASTVFVIYGSVESELFISELEQLPGVGVIAVRVPLPFNSDSFVEALPSTTQSLVVIGQSLDNKSSLLKANVNATVFLNGLHNLRVSEFIYSPTFVWSSVAVRQIVSSFVVIPEAPATKDKTDAIFWCLDNSKYLELASRLAHVFSLDESLQLSFKSKFDNEVSGGVYQAQISVSHDKTTVGAIDNADIAIVDGKTILEGYNVVKTVKSGGVIVLAQSDLPHDLKEFVETLPVGFRRNVAKNKNKLIILDLTAVGEVAEAKGRTGMFALQAVFWKYAAPHLDINDIVRRVIQASGSDIELLAAVITTIIEDNVFTKGIKSAEIDPHWAELPLEENEVALPVFPTLSAFTPNPRSQPEPESTHQTTYIDTVKKFVFPEAFGTTNSLRPDLPVRNFVVKVQENRRVTPADYSRNIFHIEFDITGTGLTYDIGEALGVHGRNDAEEVQRFLEVYGLDPDALISVPHRENNDLVEVRTVFQAFTENLDLLGKPGKKFYESLAPFATDEKEKKQLEKLGSAEGAGELKRFQEIEFYSYSDIFEVFPSARPSLEELVALIPPLKRREYSIASSQKMHPNAVHLLIVVVDWIDARKRKRYGQCSRYLSQLAIGTELVVSVKPSVMKLPPLSTQPIVMSGLGTGLAPFKAFVEEKIWQKQQGMEIGEIYLYLGARHRKEEYLYGELWEAYKAAGVITHIGAAFSRDQPEKIYIQDRIRQTLPELKEAVVKKNGSFYLCGPVWPVPDITAALEEIVATEAKERGVEIDAAKEVEEMKENSRYILEVY